MSADDIPRLAANWERILARYGTRPLRFAAPASLTIDTPPEAWPEQVPWQRVHDACQLQREDRPKAKARRVCARCRNDLPSNGRECRPCGLARRARHVAKRKGRTT